MKNTFVALAAATALAISLQAGPVSAQSTLFVNGATDTLQNAQGEVLASINENNQLVDPRTGRVVATKIDGVWVAGIDGAPLVFAGAGVGAGAAAGAAGAAGAGAAGAGAIGAGAGIGAGIGLGATTTLATFGALGAGLAAVSVVVDNNNNNDDDDGDTGAPPLTTGSTGTIVDIIGDDDDGGGSTGSTGSTN